MILGITGGEKSPPVENTIMTSGSYPYFYFEEAEEKEKERQSEYDLELHF